MKILRVRRGFTTNSSASSEWIPPPGAAPGAAPGATSGSPTLPSGAANFTPQAKVVLPMSSGQTSPATSWSDSMKVGGLVGIVALAFVIEKVIRKFRARKTEQSESDG
jgi:hypothetical protein